MTRTGSLLFDIEVYFNEINIPFVCEGVLAYNKAEAEIKGQRMALQCNPGCSVKSRKATLSSKRTEREDRAAAAAAASDRALASL